MKLQNINPHCLKAPDGNGRPNLGLVGQHFGQELEKMERKKIVSTAIPKVAKLLSLSRVQKEKSWVVPSSISANGTEMIDNLGSLVTARSLHKVEYGDQGDKELQMEESSETLPMDVTNKLGEHVEKIYADDKKEVPPMLVLQIMEALNREFISLSRWNDSSHGA